MWVQSQSSCCPTSASSSCAVLHCPLRLETFPAEWQRTPDGKQVTAVTQNPPQELSSQVKFQRSAKPWWSLMGCRRFCHLHSRHPYWGYFLPYLAAACWKTGVQPGSLSSWVNKQACILLKKNRLAIKKDILRCANRKGCKTHFAGSRWKCIQSGL